MEIVKMMVETENSKQSREKMRTMGMPANHRMFKWIEAGDYRMSIQASEYHYCEPRLTLEDLSNYEEMELALFKNGEWVQPREDEKIKSFPRYAELEERYEKGNVAVAGYVPVDLLQDLYDYLSA